MKRVPSLFYSSALPVRHLPAICRNWPVLILPMIATSCAALMSGQDANWDILNYHFYSGFAFLHKPLNYDFAAGQVQSFLNPVIHVISYLMLAHLPARLGAMLLGAVQGLNFFLLFQIAQVIFRNWTNPYRFVLGLCSAAAGCYGAAFITELGTTFGDNLLSIFILFPLLIILRTVQLEKNNQPARDFRLVTAGVILGATAGLKLTVMLSIVAVAVSFASVQFVSKRPLRHVLILVLSVAIGFVAVYGFWGWSLYREYRNPVFPYMNALFSSPYYDPQNLVDARFMPRTWQQAIFYPFFFAARNQLVSEIEFRDARLAGCYVAVVALLIGGLFRFCKSISNGRPFLLPNSQTRLLLFLTLFFVISYALWQYQFSIYRYLVVLELLAPLFLALVVGHFFRHGHTALYLSLLIDMGVCLWVIAPDFGRRAFEDGYLRVEVPQIEGLEKSLVLMGGYEATSFVIPSFPAGTRFVRIRSNFHHPGRNVKLDQKIRALLEGYDVSHTFVYLAGEFERESVKRDASYYGVIVDDDSCRPIHSRTATSGFLCATLEKSPSTRKQSASPVSRN